jgi:hypothetical protein
MDERRRDKEVKDSTVIDAGIWSHSRPEIAAEIYNKRAFLKQDGWGNKNDKVSD